MKLLTVVNRTKGIPFVGKYDGEDYVVEDRLSVPDYLAYHLKRQSIYRDNPIDPARNEYRLYIEGVDPEPENPVPDELPWETLDRSDMDPRAAKVTKLVTKGSVPLQPRRTTGGSGVGLAEMGKDNG